MKKMAAAQQNELDRFEKIALKLEYFLALKKPVNNARKFDLHRLLKVNIRSWKSWLLVILCGDLCISD